MKNVRPVVIIITVLLVLIYATLSLIQFHRSGPGKWNKTVSSLLRQNNLQAVIDLGLNLADVGKADFETQFLALRAAASLNKTDKVEQFSANLQKIKYLNYNGEREIERFERAKNWRGYRTRIHILLMVAISLTGLVSLREWRVLFFTATVALSGIVLLLI